MNLIATKEELKITVTHKEDFIMEFSHEELSAIKKLIGKTSHYDRTRLGLTDDESILCGHFYSDLKGIGIE